MAWRLLSRSDGDDLNIQHEINVTPFIDVMLVLLIIFMVAAPLATVDIGVNLPASTAPDQPRPDKPVFVTIKPDASIAVGETIISRDQLPSTLDAATNGH
jgi:biopolymer transport protein ExbD